MTHAYIIFVAYVLDIIFGDPYSMPHPVKFIGNTVSFLEKKFLNTKINKFIAGILTFFITVFLSYFITYFIIYFSYKINKLFGIIIESIFVYTIFASKCLEDEAMKIYNVVKKGDLKESRKSLSYIVGRDTNNLSFSDIIKATVETVSENTVDAVISPLFFLILGGAPLAMAFKAVSTLDSMIGYRNEKYEEYGKFSAKCDDICNFLPARISVILFVISSFLLGLNWKNCLKIGIRDRKNHLSPNCAYPEGLVAGALGIQLGGAHYYFGKLVIKPTIGDEMRNVDEDDILNTIKLLKIITILSVIISFFVVYYII